MTQQHRAASAQRARRRAGAALAAALTTAAAVAAVAGPAGASAAKKGPAATVTKAGVMVPFMAASSSKSFSSTVSSLKSAVSSAGMMVLGTLNQAGALSVTGLQLRGAETFFVGNPTVGKKLFEMNPAIGAVIPVRIYVWVNAAGKTEVGYLQPSKLASAVDPKMASSLKMIDMTATKIAKGATGSAPKTLGTVHGVEFISKKARKSFSSTVSGLKTAVSSKGMMVLGSINQAGALSVTGLQLKGAETFFVGNPTVGKKLFQMTAAAGMEIPVGMYLWVNGKGASEIGYFQPGPVLRGISKSLGSSAGMFNSLASGITKAAA